MRTERGWWQRGMAVVLAGALVFVMLASAQGQNVTTVTLWSWTPDAPFMKKMVAAFEKDHPSIHIETTIQPSSTYWTALKAAAGTLFFFPAEQPLHPSAGSGFVPIGKQAMQVQGLGFGTQDGITHRRPPSAHRKARGGRAGRGYLSLSHGLADRGR